MLKRCKGSAFIWFMQMFFVFLSENPQFLCFTSEGVRRNALRVLRPKSPHSEGIAQYIEWRDLRGPRPIS